MEPFNYGEIAMNKENSNGIHVSYIYNPGNVRQLGLKNKGRCQWLHLKLNGQLRVYLLFVEHRVLIILRTLVFRTEDLRVPFGEFGPLKDVYLPRDYYTGEPRGFGFVQYLDPDDAAEAKYQMDGQILLGRELTVVFAEENRKKPSDMRARERSRGRSYDPRGSSIRYSRSPPRGRSYQRSPRYRSPPRRYRYSRSISPRDRRYRQRDRSYSRSPYVSRSRSPTPFRSRNPQGY
uniref:serine/arginine-rich SC35-like splicing factor SCL30A n=1 Tax=Erigeron canadensis TaxID=72917 RepID=UPI001CB9CA4E|nr:serine/arginine-rich SC35-like splicing factor SCL30A [Erigeron canadensis]